MRLDRGKHNEVKCKTLMALYWNKVSMDQERQQRAYNCGFNSCEPGMTLDDIHEEVGVLISTLRRSLTKWVEWGLIKRFPVVDDSGRLDWAYQVSDKGESWLRNYASEHLNMNRFRNEIRNWQAKCQEEKERRASEALLEFQRMAQSEEEENETNTPDS